MTARTAAGVSNEEVKTCFQGVLGQKKLNYDNDLFVGVRYHQRLLEQDVFSHLGDLSGRGQSTHSYNSVIWNLLFPSKSDLFSAAAISWARWSVRVSAKASKCVSDFDSGPAVGKNSCDFCNMDCLGLCVISVVRLLEDCGRRVLSDRPILSLSRWRTPASSTARAE